MDIEVEAPTENLAGELVYTILEEAYRKNRIVNCEEVEINKVIELE
jgi:hypothetical protein